MDEVNAWSILSSKWTIATGIVMALCAVITAVISSDKKDKTSNGGNGGDAVGLNGGQAIGGQGGRGGLGQGGNGGTAFASGQGSFSMGGEGGEAAQKDRGGKGGRGPLHVLMEEYPEKYKEIVENFGITDEMARKIGKGGDGADPLK